MSSRSVIFLAPVVLAVALRTRGGPVRRGLREILGEAGREGAEAE